MSEELELGFKAMSVNANANVAKSSPLLLSSSPNHRAPLSPSAHPQIQPDLHARVLAFQNKRIGQSSNGLSRSSSLHDARNNKQSTPVQSHQQHSPLASPGASNSPNYNNLPGNFFAQPQSSPPDKPLPPLPGLSSINMISSLNLSGTPGEGEFKLPSVASSPANVVGPEIKRKLTLSDRRGMKLNIKDMSDLSLPLATPPPNVSAHLDTEVLFPDTPPNGVPRQQTGIELNRRFSDRTNKKKPNLKLDLNQDDSNSNSPASSSQDKSANEQPRLPGMFANYSKYIDIKKGELKFSGKASLHSKGIDFSSGHSFRISMDELEILDELGRGNYGSVFKVIHKPTNVMMAMKEVRLELDETKFTQILMELDILHKCNSPYIVDFYGAFFSEGAVYMCMEYMDGGSLDKIYGKEHGIADEESLACITECVIRGLKELKDVHNIIHRDVKPTNILVNTAGKVKLCDFGVSGNLVASLAKTNIGCQSYMAPERIKTTNPNDASYSVQSDIWSLGLTILEVSCGHYPYPPETYDNIFSQLSAIVDGEPPRLDPSRFSKEAQIFVRSCVNKNPESRPIYASLLNSPWLLKYRGVKPHIAEHVNKRLQEIEAENEKQGVSRSNSGRAQVVPPVPKVPANSEKVNDILKNKVRQPALHRTRLLRNGNSSNGNSSFANR